MKRRKKDILVIYDDISLNLGYIRFRAKGSDGGHNGIKSVIKWLSNKDDFDQWQEEVKAQKTNHRETIKVIYDESKISYLDILEAFFNSVDPFDGEGQFIDKGFSYTLAVYYQDNEEYEFVSISSNFV